VYNESNPNPDPQLVASFYDWEDTLLTPLEPESVVQPDEVHQLDVLFETRSDGQNYAMFNMVSYTAPIVPSLLTALSVPANYTTQATVYGTSTNPFVLGHNNMVQLIVNNGDTGKHPCTKLSPAALTYFSSSSRSCFPSGVQER
jgi:iron transport multicopper oxidase